MQLAIASQSWMLIDTPPLWPLEFFTVALNTPMKQLIADCDDGKFGHVWNIAAGGKKFKRELRVFYRDGLAILNKQPLSNITYEKCVLEFIPASRGLKGTEIQKLFSCGHDLVHDLDAAALLEVERDRVVQKGPRASRLYSRESIIKFLNNRSLVRDPQLN